MVNSINTNASAMLALQNLNGTSKDLEATQKRVSTGLKIANAADNAAVYSVAQGMRGDTAALGVVRTSLDRAQSIGDVALAAGETISDLFIQLREKALASTDVSLNANDRAAYQEDFASLLNQVQQVISQAKFDGVNLIDNSNPNGVQFIADAEGTSTLTLPAENFSLGGAIITLSATNDLSSASNSTTTLGLIQSSLTNINGALARLGAATQQIQNHANFVSRLEDTLTAGVGNLVDADLAKESAMLTALQVKQQLGVQSLSIANSAPQTILSLFKN